jgi:ABC-type branched-subunit amino acid transport system substrate-binding protein
MISAPNHLLQLSGSKLFGFLIITLLGLACTPKVITKPRTTTSTQNADPVAKAKEIETFSEAKVAVLIPFDLASYDLKTLSRTQLKSADMAIDFYQGLLMGFDKASESGFNFKLDVFDTRDDIDRVGTLTNNMALKNSNLIIGPVFPAQVKAITKFAIANDKPIVSPLAASTPSDFDNPTLISTVANISVHAQNIAEYIGSHFNASSSVAVLINTKKASDEDYAAPIRNYLAKKYPTLLVQEFSSTQVFETKMMRNKNYAVVLCSDDGRFVSPSLSKLYRLKNLPKDAYSIQVFGHPNWTKQNYNIEQLQSLNTIVSSSFYVDYQNSSTKQFITDFKTKNKLEPSEYAFRGYDVGVYFGTLLAKHGKVFLDFITKDSYKGLHNKFDFSYNPKAGYFNNHVYLMRYRNMSIQPIND